MMLLIGIGGLIRISFALIRDLASGHMTIKDGFTGVALLAVCAVLVYAFGYDLFFKK